MFAATFRSLLAHRVRLALTALAIALGTGFMAGSFVFTATLTHSLDSLFAESATGTDVVVQHTAPTGAGLGAGSGGTRPVPAAIASVIRGLPGVAAADGVISARAVLLGKNGKPLPSQFSVALSWPPDPPFQGMFTGRAGRPPAGPGQVMIDRGSARQGHFTVGDRIEIAIAGQARPFTVAGITGYGSADSIAGGSMAVLDLQAAQQLFGLAGRYSQIEVKAAGGVSAQQLRDRVARVLPSGVEAVTAASAAASQAQQLNSQLNTLALSIAERTRELGLLRAIGMRRGQLSQMIAAESVIIAVIGAVLGAALGLGLGAALAAAFTRSQQLTVVIPAGQVVAYVAAAALAGLLAAIAPARRAAKMNMLAAIAAE